MTIDTMVQVGCGGLAGALATVTMDVLGRFSRRAGITAGAEGRWIGRWYLGILRGRFVHSSIADTPEMAGEKTAAFIGHYAIGIVLAVFYVLGAGWLGLSPGEISVALGYGLATCVFPWFLVFPALGFGAFGMRGPTDLRLFRSSVINHLCYGFGLLWATKLLSLG